MNELFNLDNVFCCCYVFIEIHSDAGHSKAKNID